MADALWRCSLRSAWSLPVNRMHALLGVTDKCIASYPGDFGQALVALDGRVGLLGADGARTIPFSELHLHRADTPEIETTLRRQGELITARHQGRRSRCPERACCRPCNRCRGSSNNGCAVAGCRLCSPCSDLPFSVAQVPTLLMLAEAGELSQKELVQGAVIEQPAMAQTLKRMEASDLVARHADPTDGRTRRFRLTPKAKSNLHKLTRSLAAGNDQALAGFSAEERALLIAMLHGVINNLTSERYPAAFTPVGRRRSRRTT